MTLLAKPNKSLKEHLHEALEYAERYAPKNVDEDLYKAALIATAFHDLGKADRRFQRYMHGGIRAPSHAFLGLPVLKEILEFLEIKDPLASLITLAVAAHHSPMKSNLFFSIGNDLKFEIEAEDISEFQEIINSLLRTLGFSNDFVLNIDNLRTPKAVFEIAKRQILLRKDGLIQRNKLVYINGVLMQSDYYSSAGWEEEPFEYPNSIVETPYSYQKIAGEIQENLFITLPTGAGKTETALYWARNNFQSKLFYVLPTTTTINAMYTRLRQIFGKSFTSLYHSYVDLFIYLNRKHISRDDDDDTDYQNILFYKYFMYPVNVTTPDQLILALLNYKRYTLKNFSLYNSTIILDEIHSYDAGTFFLIKYMLKYLQQYNPKICIMSATFPKKFKEELDFLNAVDLLPDSEIKKIYKARQRTKPIYHDVSIFTAVDDIIKDFKDGKKVLIVLNTVKRSQDMFDTIRDTLDDNEKNRVILFHSRFTFRDKIKKECSIVPRKACSTGICKDIKPLKGPHILVATQIVEVSLNIDYDVMYTEASYFDSLVQRAGRVNRFSNHKKPCPVHIYVPVSNLPYEKNLLETTLNILENDITKISSEYDYIHLTNAFYDQVWDSMKDAEEDRYKRVWKHVSYIFSLDLSDQKAQELIRTRSGIINIPAYPYRYKDIIFDYNQRILELTAELKNQTKGKGKFVKSKFAELMDLIEEKKLYLVNVPLFYYYALEKEYTGEYFVNLEYSEEKGLLDEHDNMI